ncbi:hypothetical protein A3742_14305 [Oleiphilus sp. HI0071]|uniref:DUF3426 domain-containing protein n=4 Tax=unclassified Oleiphilus TaxID=2631174 RepID=UPI0007C2377E|nr:DUF3426 domain-containing protein [Oleiphilus sp. HI0079]KZY68303.1 hypothetical protein A3737_03025 [Oleiphilus sp. HI0065]KZY79459.1 hypothetical protein A3742_14305 [Oleiphilus sp. HI0071]KZY92339.1 hypothetical protein A3744_14695 [Oleiphilus sp. HI0073]KZZ42879.1 hypothetical protein A3758_04720 [Oleiphilus sp. HI0118]KZZ53668.1 hypothetical protein A3760_09105 [Oleiphilus sp. HI0122]KZZ65041.1 hypothetical protein A3765_06285 [Oleiphilus sp. HI0130]KZZ78139.1 hypothetical protein A3
MNAEQYTRCPHCKSTFEVTESQLSAASGKVRCGACMEVFDALAYLINSHAESDREIEAADIPEDELSANVDRDNTPDAPDVAEQAPPHPEEDDLVFEDSAEDLEEAKNSMFEEQLSDSLKSIDTSKAHAFAAESNDDEELPEEDTDDESWANQILEDQNEPLSVKAEPEDRSMSEPFFTSSSDALSSDSTTKPEAIDFYYEETETVRGRGLFSKMLIGLGCVALLLVLLAQAAWFHYEKLVQYPLAKQSFEMFCEKAGCSLPELVDLNAIRSSNLVVRSHPITPNSLIIDVVLTNEASFDQDFPRLALYFSDINGKTVAQQIVPPKQYLNDTSLDSKLMPRDKPIHVSLEIEDPGKRAVNYKIRFFPSKGQQNSS